ncbi:MAG: polyprenyl diphosphate synthase [Candidatus Rariloculaceae bacterium]
MDGNGRWARNHGISRKEGHSAGIKPVISLVERCATIGIEVLTLFAFSSENWHRPREEVLGLMSLFLDALNRQVVELEEKGIRLCFVGDIESLTPVLKKAHSSCRKAYPRKSPNDISTCGSIWRTMGYNAWSEATSGENCCRNA